MFAFVGKFKQEMADRITQAVGEAESRTAMEIVVRVVPRSGSYRDVPYLCAFILGTLTLAVVLLAPFVVQPLWVTPCVVGFGMLGLILGARIVPLTRLFTTTERRDAQVLFGARASFFEEAVSATRDRTGVLIYASLLEDRVRLMVDHPFRGLANDAAWGAIDRVGRSNQRPLTERILAMIAALAELGERIAPRKEDDVNELPDSPRIG